VLEAGASYDYAIAAAPLPLLPITSGDDARYGNGSMRVVSCAAASAGVASAPKESRKHKCLIIEE